MSIKEEVIDIEGSSLKDRIRLRQVLLDNGEELFSNSLVITDYDYLRYGNPHGSTWYGGEDETPTITLEEFIAKYSVQDRLRNLCFYKESGENWTDEESLEILKFTGINLEEYSVKDFTNYKYLFDDGDIVSYMHTWYEQEEHPNFDNCIKFKYEDVFPTKQPKFEYPIYKKSVHSAVVMKFTDLKECECIVPNMVWSVGDIVTGIHPHTDAEIWEDWTPIEDSSAVFKDKAMNEEVMGNLSIESVYTTDPIVGDIWVETSNSSKLKDEVTVVKVNGDLIDFYRQSISWTNMPKKVFKSIFTYKSSGLVPEQTNNKENNMNTNTTDLQAIVTATVKGMTAKPKKAKRVKTDLEVAKKLPFTGVIYSKEGTYLGIIHAKTEAKLMNKFEITGTRGKELRVHKYSHTVTEDIKYKKTK